MSRTQDLEDQETKLREWISKRGGTEPIVQEGRTPYGGMTRKFMLTTLPLEEMKFTDHRFNPRTPNPGKINDLVASISTLTMLTPLTCAYIGPIDFGSGTEVKNPDEVILLDGRHRFDALEKIKSEDDAWAKKTFIDLKIYFNLEKSDIYMLATYLNKTRKSLAKGEYFKFIVHIFDEKHDEITSKTGKEPTEDEIFRDVNARELTEKNFDLSIGRIVGLTALDEEEGTSWYPMVGVRQQDKIKNGDDEGKYCPLTAGNLATFLGHLCNKQPYGDHGQRRATEIGNVLQLGVRFRNIILEPVDNYDIATGTTVACKHWTLDAFGQLIERQWINHLVANRNKDLSLLAHENIKWDKFEVLLETYYKIMSEQAPKINVYRSLLNENKLAEAAEMRSEVWSYQTQTGQIISTLMDLIERRMKW